jgi:hypothetical protein
MSALHVFNTVPALTLEQADTYAARNRGEMTQAEFDAYMARLRREGGAPITYGPTVIAQGVATNGRLDRNTLATRWHGLRVVNKIIHEDFIEDDGSDPSADPVVIGPPSNTIEPPPPARATTKPKTVTTVLVQPSTTWKKIKPGSTRARVLELMDGSRTATEIDAITKAGSSAMAHAKCTKRDCGIGYEVTAEGRLAAIYPDGITYDMVVVNK